MLKIHTELPLWYHTPVTVVYVQRVALNQLPPLTCQLMYCVLLCVQYLERELTITGLPFPFNLEVGATFIVFLISIICTVLTAGPR